MIPSRQTLSASDAPLAAEPIRKPSARTPFSAEAVLAVLAGLAVTVGCEKSGADVSPEKPKVTQPGAQAPARAIEAKEVPSGSPAASGSAASCAPGGCAPGACGGSKKK